MKPQKIEISYKTIIFTVLFLISLALLWQLRSLVLLFFICFILMECLNPTVNRLEKLKIPRGWAIAIIYVLILAFISIIIAGIVPILVEQTTGLIQSLPATLNNIQIFGTSAIDFSSQFKLIGTLPSDIVRAVFSVFSNLISGLAILMITLYLLLERKNFDKHAHKIFGPSNSQKALLIIDELEKRLGTWVNGELVLMTIIGVLSYVGYLVLGLNYAVPLAILAGLLEILPNIGPIITTGIAALIGLTMSPLIALLTVLWGLIVHQSENNFITPRVMKDTVGLNPIVTIFTIAIGAKLAGIGGAILAIPTYLTITTIVRVLTKKE
jgi:predicted PurR-regulated permease PerM